MEEVNEKKNKRIAAASTVGLHALLLVFFFFAVGWRAPNPPYPDYGIVLNFGLDDQGSGDIQPLVPVGSEQEESKPEKTQVETSKQEEKDAATEPKPVEELTAKDEDAVAVKDVKKEDKSAKTVESPKEKTDQKVVTKEPEKPLAVYKPDATKKTDGKTGQPGSEGDDVNKTGDKGQRDGQLGPGAYKGKAGGGGDGPGLSIDGWLWDEVPKVTPPNDESSGRLVFKIVVNAEGEVVRIETIERSLSLEMERICKSKIAKLTFSPTGNNVPLESVGKITFTVLSN